MRREGGEAGRCRWSARPTPPRSLRLAQEVRVMEDDEFQLCSTYRRACAGGWLSSECERAAQRGRLSALPLPSFMHSLD